MFVRPNPQSLQKYCHCSIVLVSTVFLSYVDDNLILVTIGHNLDIIRYLGLKLVYFQSGMQHIFCACKHVTILREKRKRSFGHIVACEVNGNK